jgi:hypothetical protein
VGCILTLKTLVIWNEHISIGFVLSICAALFKIPEHDYYALKNALKTVKCWNGKKNV